MIQEVYNVSMKMGQDTKIAAGIGTATTGTGIATLLNWISTGLGVLATLSGVILTIVLIRNHIKMGKLDRQYRRLRIKQVEYDLDNHDQTLPEDI